MSETLAPQTALVTGAGRGIGRAIAEHLAACGMKVAVASRTEAQVREVADAIGQAGGEALPLTIDVLDLESMQAAVSRVLDTWGRLDLLVNNAGSLAAMGPSWDTDPEAWAQDITVNVVGLYHGCRAAIPVMIEAGRGRVVNMVGGGTWGPFPNASAYASSKSAVMRFTENLAVELDDQDAPVRAFAMTPGLVRTEMTRQFLESGPGQRWMKHVAAFLERGDDVPPDLAARLVAAIAAGRLDAYHGRFLSAPEDADQVEALATRGTELGDDPDLRRLRISGWQR
ncbi:SDR family NAD(P)-dependent oxidoreductase [bacterium]|nr:SDR family NAD(P)-dependent oxidoreductase [bacterium]